MSYTPETPFHFGRAGRLTSFGTILKRTVYTWRSELAIPRMRLFIQKIALSVEDWLLDLSERTSDQTSARLLGSALRNVWRYGPRWRARRIAIENSA
jgi:hypothetical protein